MEIYSNNIRELIQELSNLPGLGQKSAQRIAFYIIKQPIEKMENLANVIKKACKEVKYCKECCTITDDELCPICKSSKRDHTQIMIVENERDLASYEKAGEYEGVYHVLHGAISPLLSIGPDELKIKELLLRIRNEEINEIILATNSSIEGEATAAYLCKLLKPLGIKITRIASGVPVGGDIENIDAITLQRALKMRITI
ncbi:MAG: recombination mediator RecR [Eubacteriales bacterium]|nr:recombination mediator RecR [Eubacteriales bacterium]